jgi:hypothetical protein
MALLHAIVRSVGYPEQQVASSLPLQLGRAFHRCRLIASRQQTERSETAHVEDARFRHRSLQ